MIRSIVSTIAIALPLASQAAIVEGDIQPYIEGGQIKTGLISEDETTSIPNVRVFFAELGEDVPNFTGEPGWLAPDGTLPADALFTFQINRALRVWNGSDFSTLSGTMELTYGTLPAVQSPLTDIVVNGFGLPIDDEGGLHDHPDYELLAPASDGVYLLDISFAIPGSNLLPSEPVWILFGQNVSEEVAEAAFTYAQSTIPSPSALPMLALAGLVAARRRRG